MEASKLVRREEDPEVNVQVGLITDEDENWIKNEENNPKKWKVLL